MKKVGVLILAIFFIGFVAGSTTAKIQQKSIISFVVISDIHTDTKKLDLAIKDIYTINTEYDSLIMNGDVVNIATQPHYDLVNEILLKNKRFLPKSEKIIINIGNHEFYSREKNISIQDLIDRYLIFSKQKKVYHDTWIKGYHFISLGSEMCNVPGLHNNGTAYLSEDQLKWLEKTLKQNYVKNRPIFVFLHQPLANTTAGSKINKYKNNSVQQDVELREILSKYPEIILFSSHTHWMVDISGAFVKQEFNICETSSVSQPWGPDGLGGECMYKGSQGIYVNVYKDRVVIRGRDFQNKCWLYAAEYIIDIKSKR